MACAHLLGTTRKRNVKRTICHRFFQFDSSEFFFLGLKSSFNFVACRINRFANRCTHICRNLAHRAQITGKGARFSHDPYANFFKRVSVCCARNCSQCFFVKRLNLFNNRHTSCLSHKKEPFLSLQQGREGFPWYHLD